MGRLPLALCSLVVGAVIPWGVTTYAPRAVEIATSTPALDVTGGRDLSVLADGWTMSTGKQIKPATLPRDVSSCNDLYRWLEAHDGADVETSNLLLSLRGTRLETVNVTNIRVVIDKRSGPPSGSLVRCPSAGADDTQKGVIVLDEIQPVLRTMGQDQRLGAPYFRDKSVTLQHGEILTFAITAYAYKATYEWHLEVEGAVGGRPFSIPVSGTYRTSARTGFYANEWKWDWSQQPGRLIPAAMPMGG